MQTSIKQQLEKNNSDNTMSKKLKYLFIAEYSDGTFEKQTPDDVSKIDPEKKRSQFYDVLQSGKPIRKFSLVGSGNEVTVDLQTGLFSINGLKVLLESEKLPRLPDKFDLIFYRQVTENTNIEYNLFSKIIQKIIPLESFCEYFIGWQCNINGKNYQQKLAIN